ncbi:molybdopterin cofactor-binding domain-containing protein [Escherichia coli]
MVGQALDIPWSCVRVIKPFVGGGFGNKQDVLEEPMAAFLTSKLGGIPVRKFPLAVKSVSSQPVPATLLLLTGKWA